MKKLMTLIAISLMPFMAQAEALDTPNKAMKVQDQMSDFVFAMAGVNGFGITGCDPETGVANLDRDFVHCLVINTETATAFKAVSTVYPVGTQIKGVYVVVKKIGTISAQPRMGAGN